MRITRHKTVVYVIKILLPKKSSLVCRSKRGKNNGEIIIDQIACWQKENCALTKRFFCQFLVHFVSLNRYIWSLCSKTQCVLTIFFQFSVNAEITVRIDWKNSEGWPKPHLVNPRYGQSGFDENNQPILCWL